MKRLIIAVLIALLPLSVFAWGVVGVGGGVPVSGGGGGDYVIHVVGTEGDGDAPTSGSGTITWGYNTAHAQDEDGNPNAAYQMENAGDYVQVVGTGISATAGTLGFKYRHTSETDLVSEDTFIGIGNSANANNFRIFYRSSTAIRGYYNGTIWQATVNVDLNDGDWHDVVMTWEQSGSDMVLKIAVDGGTAGGSTTTVEASLNTDYLYIGNRTSHNRGCLGTMSDVWIKTTADSI